MKSVIEKIYFVLVCVPLALIAILFTETLFLSMRILWKLKKN